MAQFKPGDLIELKSGGPAMTVRSVHSSDGTITTQWFSGKKLEQGHFREESVKASPSPDNVE